MSITAAVARSTKNSVAFLLIHDGAAGDTLIIDNATLIAAANVGGPIADILRTAVTSDAEARALVGGWDQASPIGIDSNDPYAKVRLTTMTIVGAATVPWTGIASNAAGVIAFTVGFDQVGTALLEFESQHSFDR